MSEVKASARFYEDEIDALLECDDECLARIVRAVFCEAMEREIPELKGLEKALYKTVIGQVHRDKELSLARRDARLGKTKQSTTNNNKSEQNETNINTNTNTTTNTQTNTNTNTSTSTNVPPAPKGGERVCVDTYFEKFWDSYPRKIAKESALNAWNKLNPDESLANTIINAVERQKLQPQWNTENGRYIPYPANYLNNRYWESEVQNPAPNYNSDSNYNPNSNYDSGSNSSFEVSDIMKRLRERYKNP